MYMVCVCLFQSGDDCQTEEVTDENKSLIWTLVKQVLFKCLPVSQYVLTPLPPLPHFLYTLG